MFSEFTINNLSGYTYFMAIAAFLLTSTGMIIVFSHFFAKYCLISYLDKLFNKKRIRFGQVIFDNKVFHRLAYLIPALILHHFSYLFNLDYPHFKLFLAPLVEQITNIYLTIGIALVISAFLNCVNAHYSQLAISKQKPIKSYIQVIKIILFGITTILVASLLLDKSPAYFFYWSWRCNRISGSCV